VILFYISKYLLEELEMFFHKNILVFKVNFLSLFKKFLLIFYLCYLSRAERYIYISNILYVTRKIHLSIIFIDIDNRLR